MSMPVEKMIKVRQSGILPTPRVVRANLRVARWGSSRISRGRVAQGLSGLPTGEIK